MKKWVILATTLIVALLFIGAFVGLSIFTQSVTSNADELTQSGSHNPSLLTVNIRKGPYLIYPGQQDKMQLLWQVDSTVTCTLQWGIDTSYALGNVQTTEYGSDHQHTHTITGLSPRTHYYYKVIAGSQIRTSSFFSAPDSTADSLKFFAYGDTRSYPSTHNQVIGRMRAIYGQDSSFQTFVLSDGDLVNNGNSESDWDSQFFSSSYTNISAMLSQLPYQSAMGNHEGTGVLFYKYFPYPYVASHYWSFDYGPAHFTVIDQYTSYGPGSPELQWIQNDLANATKPWKFIVLHEPGWSAGGDHPNNITVQTSIQPLCLQYGVSIVFGGHNHYYARAVVNGVEHLTIGGGGAPLYQPDPNSPNVVATSMSYHLCKVEINNHRLHFTAVNTSGGIIDSFSLGPQYGVISGHAFNSDGVTPLQGVVVSTFDSLGALNGLDTTNSLGTYDLILQSGRYREFFEKATFSNTAVDNIVIDAGDTTNVNVNMQPGPQYILGDVNGRGGFTGLDVVYSVEYFKGGQPPPFSYECTPNHFWYVAGDVNGSCTFTGLDVTYMVSYLKGGPSPIPCADCPPR